mmetsp:Transcript_102438/g.264884  ORF Transcript_102438/g.264884 Transcript_102438/m.264884 type:complete len:212 (-) Transcript_102438:820-1455(-)
MHLHHMVQAAHHLLVVDLAKWRLAELMVMLLFELVEAVHQVLVQSLQGIPTARFLAHGLVDVAVDRLLQVARDPVGLESTVQKPSAADVRHGNLPLNHLFLGDALGKPHFALPRNLTRLLETADHDGRDEAVDHRPGELYLGGEPLGEHHPQGADERLLQNGEVGLRDRAVVSVAHAQLLQSRHQRLGLMQARDGHAHSADHLPKQGSERW